MSSVKVFAPATIGNIGPGFDVLGLAIQGMGDTVEAREIPGNEIIIEYIQEVDHNISTDPLKNTASIAAHKVLKTLGIVQGVSLRIRKGFLIPNLLFLFVAILPFTSPTGTIGISLCSMTIRFTILPFTNIRATIGISHCCMTML